MDDSKPYRSPYVDLAKLPEAELKPLRTRMQMIFQDPFSSLNPRMTVGEIVAEPLVIHGMGTKAERTERPREMCEVQIIIEDLIIITGALSCKVLAFNNQSKIENHQSAIRGVN